MKKEKIIIIGILAVLASIYLLQEWIISQTVTLVIKPIPKGFVQFDISKIPENAMIKDATFCYYTNIEPIPADGGEHEIELVIVGVE